MWKTTSASLFLSDIQTSRVRRLRRESFDAPDVEALWKWFDEMSSIRDSAIASLSPEEREIFILHTFCKKAFRPIAAIFGRRNHKWARIRYNGALAAIEKAMPRPTGCRKAPHSLGISTNESPTSQFNKGLTESGNQQNGTIGARRQT